jgi:hypothetical protein
MAAAPARWVLSLTSALVSALVTGLSAGNWVLLLSGFSGLDMALVTSANIGGNLTLLPMYQLRRIRWSVLFYDDAGGV